MIFCFILPFYFHLLISPIQTSSPIYIVDNFNSNTLKKWEGRYDDFKDIYQIKTTEKDTFLSAKSINSDNLIVKQIEVDIVEYPYLNWKWRAKTLPKLGDESIKVSCDAAASIAVILNTSRFFPKTIKYSWSTSLKKDSLTESPFAFWPAKCDIRIVKSGVYEGEEWQTEKVNILADYQQFYGLKEVKSKMVYAIVIMTDSDNTESLSAADYDVIYFSKN